MIEPEGPFVEVWEEVKYSVPPAEGEILRACAKRRRRRRERAAQREEKFAIVGMCGERVGVIGCWGSPEAVNSPKFMALGGVSDELMQMKGSCTV
jgi:hypothetical protein